MTMAAWVYMLRCADGTLYTGVTLDVQQRLRVHNSGKGAKYTRSRLPVKLVYKRRCLNLPEALRFEALIKKLTRSQKETLVTGETKLTRHYLLQTAGSKRARPRNA